MPPVASPDTICWMKMSIRQYPRYERRIASLGSEGGSVPLPNLPPRQIAPAKPALEADRPEGRIAPATFLTFPRKSVPEIRAPDRVVLLEVGGRPLHHHPARFEEIHVVGQV